MYDWPTLVSLRKILVDNFFHQIDVTTTVILETDRAYVRNPKNQDFFHQIEDGRAVYSGRASDPLTTGRSETAGVLRDFWEGVYQDPLTRVQDESLTIRGHRLAEHIHLLDEERVEEAPAPG
jgi:hypothetical protein